MAPITAVAIITPNPGREEEAGDALARIASIAVSEDGTEMFCLSRTATHPVRFFVYEVYRDAAAFAAHQASQAIGEVSAELVDLLGPVEIVTGAHMAGDPPALRPPA